VHLAAFAFSIATAAAVVSGCNVILIHNYSASRFLFVPALPFFAMQVHRDRPAPMQRERPLRAFTCSHRQELDDGAGLVLGLSASAVLTPPAAPNFMLPMVAPRGGRARWFTRFDPRSHQTWFSGGVHGRSEHFFVIISSAQLERISQMTMVFVSARDRDS